MEIRDTVQEAKPSQREMWEGIVIEEALQIAEKRREVKGKGERERYTQLNAELQREQEVIRKPLKWMILATST